MISTFALRNNPCERVQDQLWYKVIVSPVTFTPSDQVRRRQINTSVSGPEGRLIYSKGWVLTLIPTLNQFLGYLSSFSLMLALSFYEVPLHPPWCLPQVYLGKCFNMWKSTIFQLISSWEGVWSVAVQGSGGRETEMCQKEPVNIKTPSHRDPSFFPEATPSGSVGYLLILDATRTPVV